ncbi:MAG: hypothetical protein WB809_06460 [Thermoplasmata archaeon]
MHRATRLTFGTVGIGLLAAFLVLGLSGATALHAAPASPVRDGGAALTTGHGMPAAPVHPDAPLNTGVFAAITSAPAPYSTIPAWLNFTIGWWNVTGYTISSANAGATVVVTDILSHHVQASNNVTIVSGQASYAIPLNSTWLGCAFSDPTCTNSLIDTYTFDVVTDLNGAGYGGTFATNDNTSGTFTSFITYTPTWALVSPTTTSVQAGNITVSVAYHAQYVTAVNLNIFSGATLVFTGTFIQSSPGISVAKIWYEGTPGTYAVSIQGVMVWGTEYLNSSITVTAAAASGGGTVYQNTTTWDNTTGGTSATGYFGLSAPVSGTLFLLVGLIVGILAALVAARMMMSEPPAKPAQPWSDQKTDSANTCSVCGKSFGSADELSAHAKSEHGMS